MTQTDEGLYIHCANGVTYKMVRNDSPDLVVREHHADGRIVDKVFSRKFTPFKDTQSDSSLTSGL